MDPATLAATTVGSLLIPFMRKGADKFVEAIGEQLGEDTGKQLSAAAGKAWNLVKGAFTSNEELTTLGLFEKSPELFKEPVRQLLEQKLVTNPDLARDLQGVMDTPGPGGTTSSVINNATIAGILNMQGATISGSGNVIAGVNMGGSIPSVGGGIGSSTPSGAGNRKPTEPSKLAGTE
jgi:hypothetical protein